MTQATIRKPRRMAREKQPQENSAASCDFPAQSSPSPTRLDQLQALLAREGGATIAEMVEATGWQQHSVRGAMAGALRKRGLTITSEKLAGVRRYSAGLSA